jgi:hypothetical protein
MQSRAEKRPCVTGITPTEQINRATGRTVRASALSLPRSTRAPSSAEGARAISMDAAVDVQSSVRHLRCGVRSGSRKERSWQSVRSPSAGSAQPGTRSFSVRPHSCAHSITSITTAAAYSACSRTHVQIAPLVRAGMRMSSIGTSRTRIARPCVRSHAKRALPYSATPPSASKRTRTVAFHMDVE